MKNFNSGIARLMPRYLSLCAVLILCCSCGDFLGLGDPEEENEESALKSAVSVTDARKMTGETDIWIVGVVMGGDLSNSKVKFEAPFKSATCIAIAADSCYTVRDSCMSVQLPKGEIRDALNLSAHPEILHRQICIKGDVVSSYYGLPGIQNISKYFLMDL